jgi:hypothetical protein
MREGEWRPIATAPTGGTPVLVYAQDLQEPPPGVEGKLPPFMAVAAYHEDAGWCVCELRVATHWMPLPEPPRSTPS